MSENLFTMASRLEESRTLIGYRVMWYEDDVFHQMDFSRDHLEDAERLRYEKNGTITGIRMQSNTKR